MEKLRKFETEEEFLNEKNSLGYPNVSYTKDSEKVWIKGDKIVFMTQCNYYNKVEDYHTFEAKYNMTWEEFINQENAIDMFVINPSNNEDVLYYHLATIIPFITYQDGTIVNKNDIIIPNYIYLEGNDYRQL